MRFASRITRAVRVLGMILLLPLVFGFYKTQEWKEMNGEVDKSPAGLTADGKATGIMRENMNNQGCAGEDLIDVVAVVRLHNDTDGDIVIDEEAVHFIVDGERHDIRQGSYKVGDEQITTQFRRITIKSKKTEEVKVTSHAFLPTTELETANTIEVVLPSDKGNVVLMYSGLANTSTNFGGVPIL